MKSYRKTNQLYKQYDVGKEYPVNDVKVKVFTGKSWVYKDRKLLDPSYTFDECKEEIKKISSLEGFFLDTNSYNKTILTYQPHFYEKENKLWNDINIKNKLLENRKKYLKKDNFSSREILRGFKISGIYVGFSHFNPLWIKAFIKKYDIKSIYDPCGGWGQRLLGAKDISYIYNDWDLRTYNGVKKIIRDFNITNKVLYNNDCTSFIPIEDYDAVFTCPPYFNIEVYNNRMFKDINDFEKWWMKMIQCSIKNAKIFAYVINHTYLNLTKIWCKNNNLIHIEDIDLGNKSNHFQKKCKINKKEILVVFKIPCSSPLSP